MSRFPAVSRKLLAAVLVALTAAGVTAITLTITSGPAGTPAVTIHVDGPDVDHRADDPLAIPKQAIAQAEGSEVAHHDQLRSELPAGVTRQELQAAEDQQDRLAQADNLPVVSPLAAPQQAGCRSRFVANYSSRRGVSPRLFVLHYTVSANRPGWGDVDAVTALFDRPSFQASSNYVIDREGHCAYIVRESDKAWTQAAANPVSISVEIINSGREPSLISGAGLKKLVQVAADSTRRWKIPARLGAVSGCTVTRSGIVTHQMLGQCGGGHVDVSPYQVAPIVAAIADARNAGKITSTDRATCRRVNWWRTHGRPEGKPEANAVRRRKALEARHVRCTARGAVKAV